MKIPFSILSILALAVSIPQIVVAYEVISPTEILPNPDGNSGDFIAKVIAYGISFTAILAMLAITWGAIQMILASGEEEKIKKSRMIIIYAFVGLLVSGMAYSVVKLITGVTL